MDKSLTHKTFHNIKWSSLSAIIQVLLQLGYSIIMSRLLSPSAFGIVAMTNIVLNFATFFAKMGLSEAIIQKQALSKEEIRAAFTTSTLLGLLFYILIYFLAPLSQHIFNTPEIVEGIRLMGLLMLISGFSATSISLLKKGLKFKELAIINIISYTIAYPVIGLLLARLGFGYSSIILAALSQAFINAVCAYFLVKHSLKFIFSWVHYQSLLNYGSKMSLLTFVDFIGSILGDIVIGNVLGKIKLGIYDRSKFLADLPALYIKGLLSNVLFPTISSINQDKERLTKQYYLVISFTWFLIGNMSIGMAMAAKPLVLVMLGDQWLGALVLVGITTLTTPFRILLVFTGIFSDAVNLLTERLIADSVFLVMLGVSLILVIPFGLTGFAWIILINLMIKLVFYSLIIARYLKLSLFSVAKLYIRGLPSFIITGGLIHLIVLFAEYYQFPIFIMFVCCIIGGGIGVLIGFITYPDKAFKNNLLQILDKSINLSKYGFVKKIFFS